MAHPRRAHFVEQLQEQLPEAVVAWDAGDNNRWNTGRRALMSFDPDATHHVVTQDDSVLCPDFMAGIAEITRHVTSNPISLYIGKTRPFGQQVRKVAKAAQTKRIKWVVLDELYWGVGVVIPVPLIKEMVGWHDIANIRIPNYDSKMSYYFRQQGIRTYYTQPSLVNHRDAADGNPSLVPGRFAKGRTAHNFIGDTSPLEIDWASKVLYLREDARMFVRHMGAELPEALPSKRPIKELIG